MTSWIRRARPVPERRGQLGSIHQGDEAVPQVAELSDATQVRDAKVIVNIADRGPVSADTSALKRMALNLVANAIEHSPMGGRVEVSVEGNSGVDEVVLSVSDQGPAVLAEHAPHIFSTAQMPRLKRLGIRLGKGPTLVVAHMVAQLHGGTLTVRSEPGQKRGAVFTARLPRRSVVDILTPPPIP